MLLLGVAYGCFNEGVLGTTIVRQDHLPVRAFAHYGVWHGVNVPWAVFITGWHTCYSVLFPLTVLFLLYPGQRGRPLLGVTAIGVTVAFICGLLALLTATRSGTTRVLILVILALGALALRPRGVFAIELGAFALAGHRVPPGLYIGTLAALGGAALGATVR